MFDNKELAAWLEDSLQQIFKQDAESKVDAACIVARFENGFVATGYYNSDAQDKAIMAHNINADAMLDVVLNNAARIKEAMEEETEDGEES